MGWGRRMEFQAGDEIVLRNPIGSGSTEGFYGGIRDDGGQVLFLFINGRLARCYWPAEQAELLQISKRESVVEVSTPMSPK